MKTNLFYGNLLIPIEDFSAVMYMKVLAKESVFDDNKTFAEASFPF